ncbi:SDR family oxidoreductase [Sphaerisporangium fuscum]|uniref:SDR family oxidoreductase n=1 Tax=Sphaerisporangium fuscum TaxID=2835868 RepID=UPI001BDBC378|nr:NAD(P)H-binding protein [Sphaerisporangium fuscum]
MTVLVTGGRGSVARHLVTLLRERGLDVRAASSAPTDPSIVKCDLTDPATFPAALAGVTSVFLYAEASGAEAFAKEAVAAGVEHVVLLSSSAVLAPDAETNLLARSHLDVEKILKASPLRVTVLRPGTFAGNARAWSWPIRSGAPVSLPFPGAHNDPLHEADLAEAALAVLTDPGLGGRTYTLTGPRSMTAAEQIDILARVTGRAVEIRRVTREEWKREMAEYISDGYAEALLNWMEYSDGRPMEILPTVEELTGHPARTFEQWAEEHRQDFTS